MSLIRQHLLLESDQPQLPARREPAPVTSYRGGSGKGIPGHYLRQSNLTTAQIRRQPTPEMLRDVHDLKRRMEIEGDYLPHEIRNATRHHLLRHLTRQDHEEEPSAHKVMPVSTQRGVEHLLDLVHSGSKAIKTPEAMAKALPGMQASGRKQRRLPPPLPTRPRQLPPPKQD